MDKKNKGYHKLLVWERARELVIQVYARTQEFPISEEFGLKNQLRRASVSVVLNIVEGYRRSTRKDYLHFLNIAEGSIHEIEAALELASDLGFLSRENYNSIENKRGEVAYLLWKLITVLKTK